MSVRILATRGTESQIQSASSASQSEGQIAYATDTKEFYVSDGTQFNKIGKDQLSQFSEISVESNIDTWHLSNTNRLDLNPPESNPTGITFKPDGTKAFVLGYSLNRVQMYDLSTAWDLTTAGSPTQSEYLAQSNLGGTQEDLFIDSSGTRMYVLSRSSDSVGQFTLNTAWDISDITFVRDVHINTTSLSGGVAGFVTGEGNPMGMTFKPDGTIMYLVGYTTDDVFQIPLSTAWDISTHGTITSVDVSIESTSNAVQFNNDGTVMYIMGYGTDAILQYNLSTAWDVTTASFVKRTPAFVRPLEGTGSGFYYNETEQKAFLCGRSSDFAYEVIISEAIRFSDPVSAELIQGDKVIANELMTGYTGRNDFLNSTYTHALFQTQSTTYLGYNSGAQNIRVGNTVYGNFRFHVFQGNYMDANFVSNPTGALPNIRFFNPYVGGVGVFSIGKTHNTNTTYLLGGVTDIESEADTFDHKGEITLGGKLKVAGNQPLKYKDPNLYTQGTQIVLDNFTESTQTTLDSHTPDTGSGYTNVYISPNISFPTHSPIIEANNGFLRPAVNNSNDGYRFVNDTTISTANYEARAVIRKQSSSDDPFVLFVKYIDEDNYFAMHFAANYNYCTPISVVAGTYTQHGALYYYANTSTADNVNFEVALRVVGNNVHVFYEGRYRGSREVNITGIGKAGIGFGRSNNSILTGYDLTTNAQISKFEIYELPDSLFDGSDSVHYIENGGLGIGTTSIGTAKVVIDHTNTKMLELKRNGATKARFIADSNNGQLDLYDSSTINSVRLLSSGVSYLNGGNVGIGTTSPSVGLHVYSTSGIRSESAGNASVQIMRSDNVQYSALLRYYSGNSEKWVAGLSDAGDFTGSTGEEYIIGTLKSNPLIVLKNDGNLGIGTANPAVKLTVNGGNIRRTHDANNYSQMGAGSGGGFINGYSGNTEKFMIRSYASNGVQAFFTAGNIGIGTTNPARLLHVDGSSGARISYESANMDLFYYGIEFNRQSNYLRPTTNSGKSLYIGSGSQNYTWGTVYLDAAVVQFRNSSSEPLMRFDSSTGRLGIGTTSPSAELDVVGDVKIGADKKIFSDGSITVGIDYNNNQTDRVFNIIANNSTEVFRVQENGSVGIGTTNPEEVLHIAKTDSDARIQLTTSTTRSSTIFFGDTEDRNAGVLEYDNNADYMRFIVNTAEALRITSAGNVGIGTTTPPHKVSSQVSADGNYAYYAANSLGSNRGGIYIDSNGNSELALRTGVGHKVSLKADGTSYINGGNVGIGTTNPTEKLHISSGGNIRVDGSEIYITQASSSRKPVRLHQASYKGAITLQRDGVDNVHISSDLAFQGHTYFNGLNTNVGIGTASPSAKLDVAGDVATTGNITVTKSSASIKVIETGGGDVRMTAGGATGYIGTYNNNSLQLVQNGSVALFVDTSRNVGIGTTSPTTALQVVGRTKTSELHASNGNAIYTNQGSVAIGTSQVDATAVLNIASTTKGVLFPRMTSAQRTAISSPATGLIVYQTDSTEGLYIYKSTGWVQII